MNIKFTIIAVCFAIAMISYFFCYSKKDWRYLAVAMGFTLISDYFLVIAHNYRVGVFTFCFVHIAYILRVSENKTKSIIYILAIILAGAILTLFVDDILIALAAVYAALFVQNLLTNLCQNHLHNRRIILVGLILFVLCDINVLMLNLPNFMNFPKSMANIAHSLIWLFYAPAQVLLAFSAIDFRKM